MHGITASTLPWYVSRATGVVALLLLTAVMMHRHPDQPAGPGCPGCPGSP